MSSKVPSWAARETTDRTTKKFSRVSWGTSIRNPKWWFNRSSKSVPAALKKMDESLTNRSLDRKKGWENECRKEARARIEELSSLPDFNYWFAKIWWCKSQVERSLEQVRRNWVFLYVLAYHLWQFVSALKTSRQSDRAKPVWIVIALFVRELSDCLLRNAWSIIGYPIPCGCGCSLGHLMRSQMKIICIFCRKRLEDNTSRNRIVDLGLKLSSRNFIFISKEPSIHSFVGHYVQDLRIVVSELVLSPLDDFKQSRKLLLALYMYLLITEAFPI